MDTPPHSRNYLMRIVELAELNSSQPFIAVIPELRYASVPPTTLRPELFGELEVQFMTDLVDADFNPLPDGHFNNRGHRRFADFLLSLIGHEDK